MKVVVGLQWGDEGKGKVIDRLSRLAKHIVRAQGGSNAGHTVIVGGEEYHFHLIPSGILYPHTLCYLGGGVVIDPASLLKEMAILKKGGITFEGRFFISPYAQIIMPYHMRLDVITESRKRRNPIGTTGRGIGPAYADRASREGVRVAELLDPNIFCKRLDAVLPEKRRILEEDIDLDKLFREYVELGQKIRPFVDQFEEKINGAEGVLLEGAQGSALDLTFGTYPFVTSSNTISAGVCMGAGVAPNRIKSVIGIAKAYATRVGNGPFPTELNGKESALFPDNKVARELGTTTGRARRLGWFDAHLVKRACVLSGVTSIALTKIDILDALESIKICTGYKGAFPVTYEEFKHAEPIYEDIEGWKSSTVDARKWEDLPEKARIYIKRIEELLETPIGLVSVGPDRDDVILIDSSLEDEW